MFPLRDENPTLRTPVITILIVGLNIAVWVFVQGWGSAEPLAKSLCLWGLIPGDLFNLVPAGTQVPLGGGLACSLDGNTYLTLLTHMFLHGGWFHILGNMWFLWVFGDNVEDSMGPWRFLFFYLACGLAAAAAQILTNPAAAVPMVGASGAIGGVMGGYARLYPRARVLTLIFLGFFITTVGIPAIAMLGYWFFIQLVSGVPALGGTGGGVAFWAHIGGFVAGLILVGPLHRRDFLEQHLRHSRRY